MHILHLVSSNGVYGAERVILELSRGLKDIDGCKVTIGVIKSVQDPHIEIAEKAHEYGIDTTLFPCSGKFDFKTVSEIGNFIKQNHVHLVHCHGYKSNFFGLLASKRRIPTMTTNHNWLKWHWKLKLYRFIDIFFIRYFDLIITASDKIKEEMLQYHIAENKIRVIDYGINIEDFDTPILNGALRKELGIHENEKIIGTIGRLKTEKGHIFLLQAAKEILKQFKDIKVVIVGDGPLRNQLEAQARTFGIEKNIIFTGHRKEKLELLTMMDIVVLPSVEEGLPIALLEAMAAKRPVIATRVGAIPKVIKDHENGILIPPKDADALQKSVCHLLGDPRLSHRLAVEANLTVKMNFTSERMCKKYYKLYVELTNRN